MLQQENGKWNESDSKNILWNLLAENERERGGGKRKRERKKQALDDSQEKSYQKLILQ